jgi:hypothetical protein
MANNGARSRSAALNADPTDDRSSASLRHERLTGHVGLDELSDQLRIAVVESVRTGRASTSEGPVQDHPV